MPSQCVEGVRVVVLWWPPTSDDCASLAGWVAHRPCTVATHSYCTCFARGRCGRRCVKAPTTRKKDFFSSEARASCMDNLLLESFLLPSSPLTLILLNLCGSHLRWESFSSISFGRFLPSIVLISIVIGWRIEEGVGFVIRRVYSTISFPPLW